MENDERRREAVREAVEAAQRHEAEREGELVLEANAWRQAETVRGYVAHLASTITASGETPSAEVSAWLAWAAAIAEKLDPTSKRHR